MVTTPAFADICFSNDEAADVVVKLEQGKLCESQIATLEKENELLEKQIELLNKKIDLQKQEVELSKQTIEQMKAISAEKDKSCDERVKQATPGFWKTVSTYGFFTAVGLAIGLLL